MGKHLVDMLTKFPPGLCIRRLREMRPHPRVIFPIPPPSTWISCTWSQLYKQQVPFWNLWSWHHLLHIRSVFKLGHVEPPRKGRISKMMSKMCTSGGQMHVLFYGSQDALSPLPSRKPDADSFKTQQEHSALLFDRGLLRHDDSAVISDRVQCFPQLSASWAQCHWAALYLWHRPVALCFSILYSFGKH